MDKDSVWGKQRRRLNRRQVLRTAAVGTGALGLTALGCSTQGKSTSSGGSSSSSGSQSSTQAGTPVNGGTYVGTLQANPQSLDPQRVSATAQVSISGVMSRIFRFKTSTDPKTITNHELEPDLGVSAESPDAQTWTIKLRPDAKFQNIAPVNGHAVEAEDVKATFIRSQDPKNPNAGNLALVDFNNIQTPDKQTVIFKLKAPSSPFHALLASPTYSWIFPREALAGTYDPAKVAIGSGPYLLDSAVPDVAYTYKRWTDYWDKSLGHVDTVKLAIVADPQQQLAQFGAGNIDELILATPTDVATAQQRNPKVLLVTEPNASSTPMYFALGEPTSPFQDIRVRRALSMALDRQTLSKVIFDGKGQFMVFVPSYMGKWALTVDQLPADTQQYYKYDPKTAKQLLDAAGVSNTPFKFVYLTGSPTPNSFGSPLWNTTCDAIVNMLQQVGLKTTPVTQDYSKDYVDSGHGSRQGYFDKDFILLAGTAPAYDADEIIFNHMDSQSTSNAERLKDPTLDSMIDKERALTNEDDRLKAILDIERYMADKMYTVPSVGRDQWVLVQPSVQNYCASTSLSLVTETYAKLWIKS